MGLTKKERHFNKLWCSLKTAIIARMQWEGRGLYQGYLRSQFTIVGWPEDDFNKAVQQLVSAGKLRRNGKEPMLYLVDSKTPLTPQSS